jgi:outer membrane immunogenic protein
MRQTFTKSAVLAAALALLNAPSYADDATQHRAGAGSSKEYPEFWDGFYGGINLGGNFSSIDLHSSQLGFVNPDGTCNTNSSISSFFPGVQLGYLHQYDSKIVVGVEGDITFNTQDRDNITCPCPTYLHASDRFTARNSLQGSLRGRLGYALDHNLLPFVSVGVSFADMGIKYSNEGGDVYSKNATQAGWLVGAGLEWGFSDDLSVRAEYNYKAYNRLNIAIPGIYGLTDPNGAGHLNIDDNMVRVAVNYWF